MPPDKPILTLKMVGSIVAFMVIPVQPGHAGLVEHVNSDRQVKEFPPGAPVAKFNKKLATQVKTLSWLLPNLMNKMCSFITRI